MDSPTQRLDLRLRTALARLDAAGRLAKIDAAVSPNLELPGIVRKLSGGPAVFFGKVEGYGVPVFANALASTQNVEAVFGLDIEGIRAVMTRGLTASIPPVMVDSGPSQEVVIKDGIDLVGLMPVLTHTATDGGRYITSGVVIARDPETGRRNCSFHRLLIDGPNVVLPQLDLGRHLRAIFHKAQARGEDLPIAVCLGSDLSLHYAGIAMGAEVPLGRDEYEIAGGLRGAALPLVKCKTLDLEVPAEAEFILEGIMSTTEAKDEGPFAEFVGYYAEVDPAPVTTFCCVTHRSDPIYYPIVGRESFMMRKFVMEAAILRATRAASPMVLDCELTPGGLCRFHLVLQVRKARGQDEGMQRNVALAAISVLKDLDFITLVDDDIDLRDPADVEYAVATRLDPSRGIVVLPAFRGHEYIRVSDHGVRSKVIFDTTLPYREEGHESRVRFQDVDLGRYPIRQEPDPALRRRAGRE